MHLPGVDIENPVMQVTLDTENTKAETKRGKIMLAAPLFRDFKGIIKDLDILSLEVSKNPVKREA